MLDCGAPVLWTGICVRIHFSSFAFPAVVGTLTTAEWTEVYTAVVNNEPVNPQFTWRAFQPQSHPYPRICRAFAWNRRALR